uniref:Uncharacterized protein n=1 Tax=Cannabis sativa TaxID=3483 RepID=A0A803NL15_CANSA
MVNKRRTLAKTSLSSCLPQDHMIENPDVRLSITTGISMNSTDVANPTILVGIINLATTTGQVDTTYLVGPNGQPLLPREDSPLAPHTEGMANMGQPPP